MVDRYAFFCRDDNLDYTIMQTINKWLEAIGMGRYAKNFIEQGFATPRQILLLTSDDLERLGIGALEHRKRILKAINKTREQVVINNFIFFPYCL